MCIRDSAKPIRGQLEILLLAAFLCGLGPDRSRPMLDEDTGLDLIAMLPAGSGSSLAANVALLQQLMLR